jgi:hypothetical protein
MRVGQARDRLRFAVEARVERRVPGERRREDLDRDRPPQPRIAGLVHLAHPARAERRDDLVRTEAGTGGQRH